MNKLLASPVDQLREAGLPVELLSESVLATANSLTPEEVSLLIDINRRFNELPLEAQMVEGGILF